MAPPVGRQADRPKELPKPGRQSRDGKARVGKVGTAKSGLQHPARGASFIARVSRGKAPMTPGHQSPTPSSHDPARGRKTDRPNRDGNTGSNFLLSVKLNAPYKHLIINVPQKVFFGPKTASFSPGFADPFCDPWRGRRIGENSPFPGVIVGAFAPPRPPGYESTTPGGVGRPFLSHLFFVLGFTICLILLSPPMG